jgi:hypothetical protein
MYERTTLRVQSLIVEEEKETGHLVVEIKKEEGTKTTILSSESKEQVDKKEVA